MGLNFGGGVKPTFLKQKSKPATETPTAAPIEATPIQQTNSAPVTIKDKPVTKAPEEQK